VNTYVVYFNCEDQNVAPAAGDCAALVASATE